jgi:hypothetical protein
MKIETAKAIVEAAESIGSEASVYEDYSGRGMYGKTTAGVVLSSMTAAIAAAAAAVADADEPRDMADDLGNLSWDSMGRDIIIY